MLTHKVTYCNFHYASPEVGFQVGLSQCKVVNMLLREKEVQLVRGIILTKTKICPEDPNRNYTVIIIGVTNTPGVTLNSKVAICLMWLFKFE